MGKFFFGLIAFFLLEIWVLIKVGSVIGGLPTLILMVLSTLLGGQLVRSQGLATLLNMQGQMIRREAVGRDLLEGVWLRWPVFSSSSLDLSVMCWPCCCYSPSAVAN